MASSKELCSIREWAPLTELIDRIPARLQRGFFPANLNLTCVDASEDFWPWAVMRELFSGRTVARARCKS